MSLFRAAGPSKTGLIKKATAAAQVIAGTNALRVYESTPAHGPCTDSKKSIFMGSSMEWDVTDRYGVLLHECCHLLYPAKYPTGIAHHISNSIDDCRIERQFTKAQPWNTDALVCLSLNVIASGKYDKEDKDRFARENFDPNLWLILWFRSHLPEDVRDASLSAIQAYSKDKGYWSDPEWQERFEALCEAGKRITRLRKVSQKTLFDFTSLYLETFPLADPTMADTPCVGDAQGGKDSNDDEGEEGESEEEESDDKKETQKAIGKGEEDESEEGEEGDAAACSPDSDSDDPIGSSVDSGVSSGGDAIDNSDDDADSDSTGGSPSDQDLAEALEKLKEACQVAGEESAQNARAISKDALGTEGGISIDCDDCNDNDPAAESKGISLGSQSQPIMHERDRTNGINRTFVQRLKISVGKLRQIAIDRRQHAARTGRIDIRTVMSGDRLGILPSRPFKKSQDLEADVPVSVAVCTDFSWSTKGINAQLNNFSHNALFALQAAGCECTGVAWQCNFTITKTIEDHVQAGTYKKSHSDNGTSLTQCCLGAVESLKTSKATRKIAFIFTDGQVHGGEVKQAEQILVKGGFEGALLVSLESHVQATGILDTVIANSLDDLSSNFQTWTRKQVMRAEGLA